MCLLLANYPPYRWHQPVFSWLQRAGCQIIIGSHGRSGRSGLGQLRLGSVATAVVPQSAIPVTVGK